MSQPFAALQVLLSLPLPVLIHLVSATLALVLGPLAFTLPKGTPGHRGVGYAWVVSMLLTAVSSLFIRDHRLPNIAGYTPIHLLTVAAFFGVFVGLWYVSQGKIRQHRRVMRITYGSLVVAGVMSFLPMRLLGGWTFA